MNESAFPFVTSTQLLPEMPFSKTFINRLKLLRGNTDVNALAKEKGVSVPTIYKAEAGERSVKWPTIEAIYGDRCKSQHEYTDLLMLWALGHTDRPIRQQDAKESMAAMVRETSQEQGANEEIVLTEMRMMTPAERESFARLASHYRRSEHTRKMCDVWMENAEGWVKELEKQG